MSEAPIKPGTSENGSRLPLRRALPTFAVAAISAMLSPILIYFLSFPFLLVLALLSMLQLPAPFDGPIESIGASSGLTLYFGSGLLIFMVIQSLVLVIPAVLLAWRSGWMINQRSSIGAGFLMSCLPTVLFFLFLQLVYGGSGARASGKDLLAAAGIALILGLGGALQGFVFSRAWSFLTHRSVPAQPALDHRESSPAKMSSEPSLPEG